MVTLSQGLPRNVSVTDLLEFIENAKAVALSLHLPKDGLIQLQSEKSSLSSFFILGSFSTKSLSHVKYRNTLLPIGSLIQIIDGRLRSSKPRLGQFRSEKEAVRQCFLFSNHLIVATRTSGGKLHLVPGVGKIPLQEATLIEDPNEANSQDDDGESSICSTSSQSSGMSESSAATSSGSGHGKSLGPIPVEQINLDFKIIVEQKNSVSASIHLVAPTMQEKQAWISDISQCLDNVHFNNLFRASISDTSSVTMPHYIKNDPKLFKDDVDIRFSRTLNSCKVPHIRYATPEKLLERLTDLRFLSIDFLNTFLLTYRVFTDGVSVLEALKKVYYSPDIPDQDESRDSSVDRSPEYVCSPPPDSDLEGQPHKRSSAFSAFSEPLELEPTPSVPPPSPVNQKHQQIRFQDEVPNNEESLSNETPAETDEIPKGSSPEPLEAGERICSRCGFVAASKNASDSPSGIDLIGESSEHLWPAQSEVSRGSGNDHSSEHWRWSHKKFEEDQKSREPGTRDDSGFSKLFRTTFSIDEEFGQCECAEDEMKISSDEHVSTLKDETTTFQEENSSEECKTEATFQEETELEVKEQTFQEDPLPVRAEENEKKDTVIHEETKATEEINIDEAENEERTKESKREHIFQEEQEVISAQETEEGEGNNGNAVRESLEMESESAVLLRRWVEVIPENQESSQEVIKINYDNVVSGICKETDLEATEIPKEQKSKGERGTAGSDEEQWQQPPPRKNSGQRPSTTHLSVGSRGRSKRMSTESEFGYAIMGALSTPRSSVQTATPRSSFQVPDATQHSSRVGVVITSSRQSQRRSSSASAAAAFAVATAGSSNPRDLPKTPPSSRFSVVSDGRRPSFKDRPARQESIISTAATMRVLNVLRHWVSKHWQDFESDYNLCRLTTEFLEDLVCCPTLLPAEHKAASQLLRLITKEDQGINRIDINAVLASPLTPSKENIETLSAMDIAEQMTYLDHHIFVSIRSEEFLKTAWTKDDKQDRAPHILVITRRFNEMSRLVVSEVARRNTLATRISVIEKWVAVADICRVLHNFNGVLQVCAAFQNSSLFRLKKTWEKVSKTTRQTLDKLQSLVSADGRFRNLRDALHRCDPPCIPYLGMYLTDLSFIEEGTPNFTEEGLLNFSKMRMVAHVIREIRHFQQTPYKIEHIPRVCSYLLDRSLLLADDELYKLSLEIEPRRMTLTQTTIPSIPVVSTPTSSTSS